VSRHHKAEGSVLSSGKRRAFAVIGTGVIVGLAPLRDARAQEHSGHRTPAEICEAFPWDVPVEQSFTVASVLRWRRAMAATRQVIKPDMPRLPRAAGR
jgi:hypothetical protein